MGTLRTVFLSVVFVAGACTEAGPPPARVAGGPSPPADGWATFKHPEQPWSWRHPPGWRVQAFDDNLGLATHEGAIVSNARHRFRYPKLPSGETTSAWDFRDVPAHAVAIEMSQTIRLASKCTSTTRTPLHLTGAELVRGAYGSPPRRWFGLCFEGEPGFGLHVWIGDEASPEDKAAVRKIVRSLRFVLPVETITCANEDATDLSGEPDYTADYLERWQTSDGCDVRLDVVMTRTGGCYSGETADLLMGWPFGSSGHHAAVRTYVRDPDDELGDKLTSLGFRGDTDLPSEARDTLLRQEETALWLVPGDDAFAYLVHPDRTEAWPLDETPLGCE